MKIRPKSVLITLLASFTAAISILAMSNRLQGADQSTAAPATQTSPAAATDTASSNPEADTGPGQPSTSTEYSPESREYHLKAAFLRYVAKFVEWPVEALSPGIINVCILGQVPSFDAIASINEKVVNDRTITISKITDYKEALEKRRCQLVFVSKTEEDKLKEIIGGTKDNPILTFGDMSGFAELGGNMNFYIMNNRLAIMTNLPAVEKSQLKLNPRMLRLVTVVPKVD